jgi:hypothetical protein
MKGVFVILEIFYPESIVLKAGYWIEAFQYDVCFARLWQKWVHLIFPLAADKKYPLTSNI